MKAREKKSAPDQSGQWFTVRGSYRSDGSWDPDSLHRVRSSDVWKLRTQPPDAPCSVQQAKAHVAVYQSMWAAGETKCPTSLAESGILGGLEGSDILRSRLMAWPADRSYPPVPDDTAMAAFVGTSRYAESIRMRWWAPNAKRRAPSLGHVEPQQADAGIVSEEDF